MPILFVEILLLISTLLMKFKMYSWHFQHSLPKSALKKLKRWERAQEGGHSKYFDRGLLLGEKWCSRSQDRCYIQSTQVKSGATPHNPPPSPHTLLLAYYGAHSGQEVQLFAFAAQVVAVWSVSTPCLWFHVPLFNCFDSLTNIKILRFFNLGIFTLHTFSDFKASFARSFSYGLLLVAVSQAKPATSALMCFWAVSTLRMTIRARQVGLL